MAACPRCGEENPDRAKFCLNCGATLQAAPPSREERKLVSVLFVDLVGFTARSDQADPEDVRDLLQAYHRRAKDEIEVYGGIVDKFIGDAVMAVFGAPTAHGDDPERAVRAGLKVLEALTDLNQRHAGLELSARAAVNTGEAIVNVGSRRDVDEALALGDVVNTASRLQTSAPPGGLIVGAETYRATRGVIRYEPLESVEAKGKRDPLDAWLAVAPIGGPAERPTRGAPFVGREREVTLIESIWDRAIEEKRPHLVTVTGPAGIGKSRLAREVRALVETKGGRAVVGRCLPYEERTGYRAFGDHVRQVAGIFESDSPDIAREKLGACLVRLMPSEEAPEIARSLSLLLGLGTDERTIEQILLLFAARRFIESLAGERPTLVVVEDLHWGDAALLDLLEYQFSHVRDCPAVFLVLARPELLDLRPNWGSGLHAQSSIPLEPLTGEDCAAIASHVLGDGDDRSAHLERLVLTAEGNPLFVEELAASIAETEGDAEDLPTTVRSAIASRIDALPPEPRAVLLDASVVGRTFWRGVLKALRGSGPVDDALEALELRDLIRHESSSQLEGDAEFTFKHALVRDGAYGTLPRAERRERHALVARHVEEAVPALPGALLGVVAYHWREAGEPRKAIEYLLRAAERAQQAWAKDEAMELFARAIEIAETDRERTRIRLLRGIALTTLGEYEEADSALSELLPELEGMDRLEALLARGRAAEWTENTEETLTLGEKALRLAEHLGAKEFVGPATARLSQGFAMRGGGGDLERALDLGARALDLWVPGERDADLAEHTHMHANQHYWTGNYEKALELSWAGSEFARDPNSADTLIRAGGLAGLTLTAVGRYEEALDLFDAQIALGRELGRPVRVVLNYSTMALRELYDLEEARRRSEEALTYPGVPWFLMPRLNAVVDLLFAEIIAGEFGKAESMLPSTWDEVRQGKAWEGWLLAGRMTVAQSEVELRTKHYDDALKSAQRAVEGSLTVGRRKYEAAGRMILGEALLAKGRAGEAVGELRAAAGIAETLGSPPGRWQTKAALGRALYATGEDDGAERTLREAAGVIREVANSLAPQRASRFLETAPVKEIFAAAEGKV